MPLVSIVVPIYKVEKYLDRCVKSIQAQTLKNIEIILVDDGSPDNCPRMCDDYAKQDSRIKVVHKKNGGLSSARNAGMEVATGKYIGFVDSDDAIVPDMYERMVNIIEENHCDFVMADYNRIESSGNTFVKTLDIQSGKYTKQDIIDKIFSQLIMRDNISYGPLLSVWHCMYSADFFKKYDIFFDDEVCWSEDNLFSSIVGYYADSFYYMKGEALYNYYQNAGSISMSYKSRAWNVYSLMNIRLCEFFADKTDYDFSNQLKLHLIFYACNCINMATTLDKKQGVAEIKRIVNNERLKFAFKKVIVNVPWKLKIELLLIKHKCAKTLYFLLNKNK